MRLPERFFLNRERAAVQRFGLGGLGKLAYCTARTLGRRTVRIILLGLFKQRIGHIVQADGGIRVIGAQYFFARHHDAAKHGFCFLELALQEHHTAKIGQCRQRGGMLRAQLAFMHGQRLAMQGFRLAKVSLRSGSLGAGRQLCGLRSTRTRSTAR